MNKEIEMKSRLTVLRLAAGVMIAGGGLWAVSSSWGQQPTETTTAAPGGSVTGPITHTETYVIPDGATGVLMDKMRVKAGKTIRDGSNPTAAIRAAAQAFRDASSNEAKAAAQAKLAELLGKYFDEDMVRREAEVTKIEQRLTKLRELLDRRRTKKQEIVELQTKVVLNEADGLGFYESTTMGGGTQLNGITFFSNDADSKVKFWRDSEPSEQPDPFDGRGGFDGGRGGDFSSDSDPLTEPAASSATSAPAAED
jgi:hypothetical protein